MNLRDAVLYIELAAYIHRNNAAVKKVAKRLVKRVHPNYRPALALICESKNPLAVIKQMAEELSKQHSTQSPWPYEGFPRPPLRSPQQRA